MTQRFPGQNPLTENNVKRLPIRSQKSLQGLAMQADRLRTVRGDYFTHSFALFHLDAGFDTTVKRFGQFGSYILLLPPSTFLRLLANCAALPQGVMLLPFMQNIAYRWMLDHLLSVFALSV